MKNCSKKPDTVKRSGEKRSTPPSRASSSSSSSSSSSLNPINIPAAKKNKVDTSTAHNPNPDVSQQHATTDGTEVEIEIQNNHSAENQANTNTPQPPTEVQDQIVLEEEIAGVDTGVDPDANQDRLHKDDQHVQDLQEELQKEPKKRFLLPKSVNIPVPPQKNGSTCTHEVSIPYIKKDGVEKLLFDPDQNDQILDRTPGKKPAKEYPFELDAFQSESVTCLENFQSVLVSAHTSAGKTVVAEYAIAMSLRDNQRVIYTSPIKALSNQKYRELEEEFKDVGLMTGDVTINPNASCLVMTTEILRSMLYRGSEVVREIAWVIFDEVHYMRDKERGVVWEETIILVPKNVRFVFLSATIPNAREFSEWIAHLKRQPCHTIYTGHRPTPLQHYLFPSNGDALYMVVDERGEFIEENFSKALAELESGITNKPSSTQKNKTKTQIGQSDCFKVIQMIMQKNYEPVICFAFSRANCEQLSLQLGKLSFNSEEEQEQVAQIYENAIDALAEEDKKIPQVTAALPLLKKGIGIHHSGLLPIVKEVVEILFQEGLLKALFATETFSMGLNMPARTVVFTSIQKYDGESFRNISGGEYIQMSGRAGRRGLDDKGITILMMDSKLEPENAKAILKGQADPLHSTFHLGYNMLLNLLRAEDADPEYVISRSLAQFQANRSLPDNKSKLKAIDKKIASYTFEVDEVHLREYYHLREAAEDLRSKIRDIVFEPKHIVPFLQVGRLVRITDRSQNYDFGWGAVVNFYKRVKGTKQFKGEAYEVDVLLCCEPGTGDDVTPPRPFNVENGTRGAQKRSWRVIPCSLQVFDAISVIRIFLPKDLKPEDCRLSAGKSIEEVLQRFPDGIALLDPLQEMKIESNSLASLLRKVEAVDAKVSENPTEKLCKEKQIKVSDIMKSFKEKLKDEKLRKEIKRNVKIGDGPILQIELKRMTRVLRRLGFINQENVVEVKGRTACEINTADELVLTELMFNGSFNELEPEVIVALLSCFVFDERSQENVTLLPKLKKAFDTLKEIAKRVGTVILESKISIDVKEYVDSFQGDAMNVIYQWCRGKSFSEICKLTAMYEGSIIRCMRRLEELLRQLIAAAKSIGNSDLESKFLIASEKLKRGVPFQASLYL